MDSILTSVKKMLMIAEDDKTFDVDIMMHINSVFLTLNQIGVGPAEGFYIENKSDTWEDFLGEATNLEAVKSYMFLKVRLLFDPPLSSAVIEASNRMIAEFEWRLRLAVDAM